MLTGKQRAYLRGMASVKDPVTQIGKNGITEPLVKTLSDALDAHELIQVTVLETCPVSAKEALEYLAAALHAEPVQAIGRKITLYRMQKDPDKRRISLPR